MIDWYLQGVHAARSRAIYFLRRWEQGQTPPHSKLGVCGNLTDVMRYDRVTGIRMEQWKLLPTSIMLAYPYRREEADRQLTLAGGIYDLIDILCVDWPDAHNSAHYPINGLAGYIDDREFGTLWTGGSGEKRRRLCGWLADQLEREEV